MHLCASACQERAPSGFSVVFGCCRMSGMYGGRRGGRTAARDVFVLDSGDRAAEPDFGWITSALWFSSGMKSSLSAPRSLSLSRSLALSAISLALTVTQAHVQHRARTWFAACIGHTTARQGRAKGYNCLRDSQESGDSHLLATPTVR